MPAVTQRGSALHGARASAANPYRHRSLNRFGREAQAVETPDGAAEGGHVRGPQLAHDSHHLTGYGSTAMEVEPQRVRLLAHATGADAQNETPARQLIERRRVLRQLNGVVIRQYNHRRTKRNRGGLRGQERQNPQRVEVRLVVEPVANEADVEQVVHGPDGVEAKLLGLLAEGHHIVHVVDAPVVWDRDTYLHCSFTRPGCFYGLPGYHRARRCLTTTIQIASASDWRRRETTTLSRAGCAPSPSSSSAFWSSSFSCP